LFLYQWKRTTGGGKESKVEAAPERKFGEGEWRVGGETPSWVLRRGTLPRGVFGQKLNLDGLDHKTKKNCEDI